MQVLSQKYRLPVVQTEVRGRGGVGAHQPRGAEDRGEAGLAVPEQPLQRQPQVRAHLPQPPPLPTRETEVSSL